MFDFVDDIVDGLGEIGDSLTSALDDFFLTADGPDREEVEQMICQGLSFVAIADMTGYSYDIIQQVSDEL